MADDELDEEEDVEVDGDEGDEESSSGGKKKLFIIIGLVVLLLIGGGGAAAFFTGMLDPLLGVEQVAEEGADGENAAGGEGEGKEDDGPPGVAVFFDLPEMLVNLNTGGRKSTFLKIRVSLELADEKDVPKMQQIMPKIVDNFQVYLRELRLDDLKGSAGIYRLKEELLTRVNAASAPAKVNDVLFKEMLVQ